jgi:hypothetical protein
MMDDLEKQVWFTNMKASYVKFGLDMALAKEEGMNPDKVMTERHGGYVICFRMHESITKQVAEFAARAKSLVPSLVAYDADTLHTTLSTLGVAAGFVPYESKDHAQTLVKLAQVVAATEQIRMPASCAPSGFVFNKTTGILKGIPGDAFLLYAETVVSEAKKLGLDLKLPWGGHTTFARVSEPLTPTDARKIAELCEKTTLEDCTDKCVRLEAGFFWVSHGRFNVEFTASFPLFDD